MHQQYPGIDPHLLYFVPFFAVFGLAMAVIMIIPYWFIFKKAGFSPWLCLLFFIPLANIIVLYVVAFSQWKVVPVADLAPGSYPPSYPPTYTGSTQPLPPAGPTYRG